MWPAARAGFVGVQSEGPQRTLLLVECSAITVLTFSQLGVPNFHFALEPENYAAGSTSCITITWGILWNAVSWTSPRDAETGVAPSNLCFKKPSRWLWHMVKTESHCLILGPLDFSGLFPSPLAPGLQLLLALLTPFSHPEILFTNLLFEGNQYFLIFSENFRLLQCIPLFQKGKEETCAIIDSDVILPRIGGGKIWVSVNGVKYSLVCRIPWLREKPETEVGVGLCS